MTLKIREIITGQIGFKFMLSVFLSVISLPILLLSLFYIMSLINSSMFLITAENKLASEILFNLIIIPIIIFSSFYLILKRIKTNNPIILAVFTSVLSSLIIYLISLFFDTIIIDIWFLLLISLPIIGLIVIWIILVQTLENIVKAIGGGIFIYFVIIAIIGLIQEIIYENWWMAILRFILAVFGAALYTLITENIIKRIFNKTRLLIKYES